MSEEQLWAFPEAVQPKHDETQFDLERAFDAVVLVRAEIPEDAQSAANLGTERAGYGVAIRDDGLVLTIGYLINEATQIWLTTNRGVLVPGYPLAYDQATGFGLIQPLAKLAVPHLERGSAAEVNVGDSAFVIGHGGRAHSLKTRVIAKHEFAGYWEYVLDEALFTAPAHPQWGGAALLDALGNVVGIGSLLVQREVNGEPLHVNMFVPIDLLDPILNAMLKTGRSPNPPRPWLGMSTQDPGGQLVVARLSPGGPASRAGIHIGDLVLSVGSTRVHGLAEFFRTVWGLGAAGVDVPLTLSRGGDVLHITVKSGDRNDYLRKPKLH
ncbi:MAG TPA: S1C family serine protease [Burkholderiales bacterium]|nr:S1C family serine protease [Burkholderiales bacterium]